MRVVGTLRRGIPCGTTRARGGGVGPGRRRRRRLPAHAAGTRLAQRLDHTPACNAIDEPRRRVTACQR